ncbi:MAG: Glycine dehydrogenase [decarboxylating] (glycine cleavage system P1 protein) [uncultured Thermomicrobiales bacterium]|uniref:Probable glycine dehydrogenase (decarboxylating) subunit 1 n=1 Tax=uncultured Thermomicrobiales bacterium TaxID=1645740 RepID=A0A6J4UJF9_9BACT|nr:MAG: Glycine dehydrogenase [decarboxylating] (glycine cleavage system P1 protein) [uncultured Thermomicrobiales bacterium]
MTFNPHTRADRAEMLAVVGEDTVADLFTDIPEAVRFPNMDLPPALTEMEAAWHLQELASKNLAPGPGKTFLGAGSYSHFIPATVGQILARGEFYTAYTPYQPEVAQGTLQTIYEFQSMVAALLGMDVANASMYDGATALAEGALVTVSSSKKRKRVVVTGTVHPRYREVLSTYFSGLDADLVMLPIPEEGFAAHVADVQPYLDDGLASVVVQYPNFFGGIEDVAAFAEAVHTAGAKLVVSTYPVPLSLLKSPGELGADVVTAEGQALGVAQGFGGPYVGLLATSQDLVRQLPGRLAGMTRDMDGKRGFVLTLQTREQHIRREKATSNICTNQGLMATAATVYMSTVGPEGFREVGRRSYQNAHYLATRLASVSGCSLPLDAPFFHEFPVTLSRPVAEVNRDLLAAGIIGGFDLGSIDPRLASTMLVCTTELHDRAAIDRFVEIVAG